MERTSHERDYHPTSEPDKTVGKLLIGREYVRSIRPHKGRCMDLEISLAGKSRRSCHVLLGGYPSGSKEQESLLASYPYHALPGHGWSQFGDTFHGITDSMGSSISSCPSAI